MLPNWVTAPKWGFGFNLFIYLFIYENVIKLVEGEGFGQICQEVVSEILEQQAKNCFSRVGSKVLVFKKYSNSAGRGILSQSRMHIFKNFPAWGLAPRPTHFQYLLLYQLEHAAGYRDHCLLPLLKQSHQKSLYYNVHEMM